MYFNAEFRIDPSQATKIENVKPKYLFQQLLRKISTGKITKAEEQETFSALAILQQFNAVFQSVGIGNMIRLSKDKTDYYYDEKGVEGDAQYMVEKIEKVQDEKDPGLFQHLYLILEHHESDLHFLIEIQINRVHQVGEYPIRIIINGLLNEFYVASEEGIPMMYEKMLAVFKKQEAYDEYVKQKMLDFKIFVRKIELAIHDHIGIDDLKTSFIKKIIIPRTLIDKLKLIPFFNNIQLEPIFHGYFQFDKRAFYAWHWGQLCQEHRIQVNICHLVNERGGLIKEMGAEKQLFTEIQYVLKSGMDTVIEAKEKQETDMVFSFSKLWNENVVTNKNKLLDDYSFSKKD